VTQAGPERVGDVGWAQECRRNLVEQRCELVVVAPVDQEHVDARAGKTLRAGKAAEAAADDDNAWAPIGRPCGRQPRGSSRAASGQAEAIWPHASHRSGHCRLRRTQHRYAIARQPRGGRLKTVVAGPDQELLSELAAGIMERLVERMRGRVQAGGGILGVDTVDC
jgi:hypothetical protein